MLTKKIWITVVGSVLCVGVMSYSLYSVKAAQNFERPSITKDYVNMQREARIASQTALQGELVKLSKITADQAQSIILQSETGAKMDSIKVTIINNSLVYSGFTTKGKEQKIVIVDAGTGEVLKTLKNPIHPGDLNNLKGSIRLSNDQEENLGTIEQNAFQSTLASFVKVTQEEAKQIILKTVPGADIVSLTLIPSEKNLAYKANFLDKNHVKSVLYINGDDGTVIAPPRMTK